MGERTGGKRHRGEWIKRAETGEEKETVERKRALVPYLYSVLYGMGGAGSWTHHSTISRKKKKKRGTISLSHLALRKGTESGREKHLYFSLTPS